MSYTKKAHPLHCLSQTMAGLYIHIPFCKKRCIYCDFFSTTENRLVDRYLNALKMELSVRASFFERNTIDTIYIGGGTPTQLTIKQLNDLFICISQYIDFKRLKEVTIEANPDDLTTNYIQGLYTLPINRLSIGVQSFQNRHLEFLNRRHSASQALHAIKNAQSIGFKNISIDLMFGLPNQTDLEWANDLQTALSLNIQHISAYCLTYEPDTLLFRKLISHEVEEVDDDMFQDFQNRLNLTLGSSGFNRYEVSNYALTGYEAIHNSSYWKLIPYIGIGASAHSFDTNVRSWNVSNLNQYCSQLEDNIYLPHKENLSSEDQHNELIMLGLRTSSGISLKDFEQRFGKQAKKRLLFYANKFIETNHLYIHYDSIICTDSGYNIMNTIITKLMK